MTQDAGQHCSRPCSTVERSILDNTTVNKSCTPALKRKMAVSGALRLGKHHRVGWPPPRCTRFALGASR
jgi:hypothetical protein